MKYVRYLFSLILVIFMVFVSEFLKCKEIIFPEILALLTSCFVVERTPWNCKKINIFLLMSFASLFGVLVVRYLHIYTIFQVILCLLFCATLITKFRTNLLPLISASILPIYLNTQTFIYPISVSILSLSTVIGMYFLEKTPLKIKHEFKMCNYNILNETKYWIKISLLLILITLFPYGTHNMFFIAPPLIVSFVEFSKSKNKSTKRALKVISLLFIASLLGAIIKIISEMFNIQILFLLVIACIILFYSFEKFKMVFHPAGAILLIPLLLDENVIKYYPIQVLIGSIAIIFIAKYCFKNSNN